MAVVVAAPVAAGEVAVAAAVVPEALVSEALVSEVVGPAVAPAEPGILLRLVVQRGREGADEASPRPYSVSRGVAVQSDQPTTA